MTSAAQVLSVGTKQLTDSGVEDARSEACGLLAHVMNLNKAQVFARTDEELDAQVVGAFELDVKERAAGKPFAHITGKREFWSMPLQVSPATLIPRPDTETVLELVTEVFNDREAPRNILDLGTGSGCLLLALLNIFQKANGIGLDISREAISVANRNVDCLGLSDRAQMICGSWHDAIDGQFDLIVSNPPYIPTDDIPSLDRSVRDHEPHLALDGGSKGLDAYHYLIPMSVNLLRSDGILVVEIGIDQANDVAEIAAQSGFAQYRVRRDLSGIERALSFYKKDVGIS